MKRGRGRGRGTRRGEGGGEGKGQGEGERVNQSASGQINRYHIAAEWMNWTKHVNFTRCF